MTLEIFELKTEITPRMDSRIAIEGRSEPVLGRIGTLTPSRSNSLNASMIIEWAIAAPATVDDAPVGDARPSMLNTASPAGTQLSIATSASS